MKASPSRIPLLDLKAQYRKIKSEIRQAIDQVLESQQFILGPAVKKFEAQAASYLQCEAAIGVASGSDALLLSLMALGIGPGDAVLVPPFTFFSTVSVVTRLCAAPIFVDIDPASYLVEPQEIEALLVERFKPSADGNGVVDPKSGCRIKANIPVHLFGQSCPMRELLSLAEKVKMLRVHGQSSGYYHEAMGINSRLDEIQAAALSVKLAYVDQWCVERIERAHFYHELFAATGLVGEQIIRLPKVTEGRSHVFHQYVIRVHHRDELKRHLEAQGIQTAIYYPVPLHLQPGFAHLGHRRGDFPNAELVSDQVLALPMYPELTREQPETVVKRIDQFLRK